MPEKINVALIYGGRSVEHDVSVISATNIQDNIDKSRFTVIPIGIDQKGKWFRMSKVGREYDAGSPINMVLDASNPCFVDQKSNDNLQVDVAFVILHGTDGEDGTIQGLFKMMQIPVVGSDVLGSAIAMNKITSKKLMMHAGIPVAKCVFVESINEQLDFSEITERLGLPFIVKPANLGSSVGVTKVNEENQFQSAIDEAFNYDTSLLIEEFIVGKELECSIIGNNPPVASPAGEVELKKDYEFYSFDAKYVDGESCHLHIPADIPEEFHNEVKELSLKAYKVLGCEDFARVDLFLQTDGRILVNEINTLPGFTNISMYPKLCELIGIPYSDLISRLIDLAIERKQKRMKLETNYISGLS